MWCSVITQKELNLLKIFWNSFTIVEENFKFWYSESPRMSKTHWSFVRIPSRYLKKPTDISLKILHHGWRKFWILKPTAKPTDISLEFLHHGWRKLSILILWNHPESAKPTDIFLEFLYHGWRKLSILILWIIQNQRNPLAFFWNSFAMVEENCEFLGQFKNRYSGQCS